MFDTPIKFKYNMHGIPLYKLICDWVIEYEKDFVSRAAKAIEDLESKQR